MDGEAKNELPFRPRGLASEGSQPEASKNHSVAADSQKSGPATTTDSAKGESRPKKQQAKSKDPSSRKGEAAAGTAAATSANIITELPDFILERNKLFDELKHKHDAESLGKDHPAINVTLDLGLDKEGKPRPIMPVAAKAWESTPGSFLRHVDKDVSSDVVVAKVNDKELWDLDRPLEYACQVKYLPFTSAEGRNVFWHSSAHVLGEAAECQYQCLLSHGPPVEQGFFYDMALPEG